MALNLTKSFTFAPLTTIASSEVNTNYDTLYNAFTGLEATTSTLAKLKMDGDPSAALEVATKQYVDAYAGYKRPNLTWVSVTTVDVDSNTGTANQTKIVFPDGNYRSVTEDTAVTNKYRRLDITAAVEFTSGTEDSGVRSGITEAANTWYAIYAVKSTINTANFVLAADTTLPTQANFSTLNGRYGTNGWVYLGLIRNGDGAAATSDICNFVMSGSKTIFINTSSSGSHNTTRGAAGIIFTGTAGATTLTYSYSAGTGATAIPNNVTHVLWWSAHAAVVGNIIVQDSAGARDHFVHHANNAVSVREYWAPASEGIKLSNGPASSVAQDVNLAGFMDGVLGVGSNPLI